MRVVVKNELGIYEETYITDIHDENDHSDTSSLECNQEFGYRAPDSQKAWVSILPSNQNLNPSSESLLEESASSIPISVILENLKKDEEKRIFVDTADSNDFEFLSSDINYKELSEPEIDPLGDPLEILQNKKRKKRKRGKNSKKGLLKLFISQNDPIWDLLKPIMQEKSAKHSDVAMSTVEENKFKHNKKRIGYAARDETNFNLSKKLIKNLQKGNSVKTSLTYRDNGETSEGSSGQPARSRKNSSNSDTSTNLHHNHLERMRRAEIKNAVLALKATIPEIRNNDRIPKVQILQKAVETISYITQKVNIKETMLNLQMKRKELLEVKLARLRETLDPLGEYQLDVESNDEITID